MSEDSLAIWPRLAMFGSKRRTKLIKRKKNSETKVTNNTSLINSSHHVHLIMMNTWHQIVMTHL